MPPPARDRSTAHAARRRPPARRSAALGLLLAAAASAAPGRSARAATPDCAAASALTELTEPERRALVQACEGGAPDETALRAAIFRAVTLPAGRAAALARLLAPLRGLRARLLRRDEATPPDLPRAQASLAPRPDALAGPNCVDLRRAVETYVADAQAGEAAGSPFLHDDPALARCLGGDPGALQGVRLIALRADDVEELFVAAAAPDFAYFTWLQPRDALALGRHRFFVVAAPPGAPLAAVARVANAEVPAVWREIVGDDEVAWTEPPARTCVSLDVRLGADATLLVDGTPVPRDERGVSRVLTVTRDEHEIVALECPGGAACHVRYREALPAAALQRRTNQCLPIRLDLAARPRPTVAVLDATQGEACREAPLRADGLRQGAADHLSSGPSGKTHEFRDLAAFAAASDALVALRTRLHPAAGAATGASSGADGGDLLGTAAKEAWRQGIDLLLSFELQCTRRGDAWIYRLTATRIALGSVFGRGRHGGESLDLERFIEAATEEFSTVERLPVALAAVIDRSVGAPFLRLLADRPAAPYREAAELTVQRYPGAVCSAACPPADATCRRACAERPVVVQARRLTLGRAQPEVCRQLERAPLRGAEALAEAERAFAAVRGAPLDLPIQRDTARSGGDLQARSDRARLPASAPGWYLVVARWADDAAPADATCVELRAPAREVWADVAMSFGGLHLRPSPTPDQVYLRTRVGYMHYPRPIVGVGVIAGYALTAYAWPAGRPSWQDLAVPETGPLEWRRHALLIGGSVELRTRVARLPFDLRLRATPTLGVGWLDLRRIDGNLTAFLGGSRRSNLDVDLDLHLEAIVGYDIGRVVLQHALLFGLHAIHDPLRRSPTDVRDSGGFFIGFGLGVGGAP